MTPLLLVNYHYLRPRDAHPHPGIHPITSAELDAQIAQLKRTLHAATPEQVEAWAAGEDGLPRASFFLTFDDGLVEHHGIAPAVLAKHGVRAVFFINSRPLTERRAVTVHKVHWLRAETAPERFRQEFLGHLPAEGRAAVDSTDADRAAIDTNQYDAPAVARLKYAINFLLPYEQVDAATTAMLAARGLSDAEFCAMFYMTEAQIRAVHGAGHVIGSHGHTHRPLSRLADADADVAANLDCLHHITGARPDWLSYPWGSDWSIPEDAEDLCRRHGFRLAITLKRAWNRGGELAYRLNRVNTNEVDAMLQQRPAALMRLDRLAMRAVKTAGLPLAPWMALVKATRIASNAGTWRRRRAAWQAAFADPAWRGYVPADQGLRRFEAAELPALAEAVEACRRIANQRLPGGSGDKAHKPFFQNILVPDDLTAEAALLGAATSPAMLAIAADYLQALPRLKAMGLYHSPVNDSTTSSQLFHLDNDDLRQLKCFVNVWPVDDAAGPFTLLTADASDRVRARLGPRARFARGKLRDPQVLGRGEQPVALKGPAGTAALVDTSRCLHYGSRARGTARLVFMFQFTTWPDAVIGKGDSAAEGRPLMRFPKADDPLLAMVLGQA